MAVAEEVSYIRQDDADGGMLYDNFPRTVGIASVSEGIFHFRYSPDDNLTTLVFLSRNGRKLSEAGVPFHMRLIACSQTDDVYVLRHIDRWEFVRYHADIATKSEK